MAKKQKGGGPPPMIPTTCQGCGQEFPSKNAIFKHLRATNGACLSPEAHRDFVRFGVQAKDRVKTVVLYGYIVPINDEMVKNGHEVANLLAKALLDEGETEKWNRSYGNQARTIEIVQQDEGTGALTELMCIKLSPLVGSEADWMTKVNQKLKDLLVSSTAEIRVFGRMDTHKKFNAEMDVSHRRVECLLPLDLLYTPKVTTQSRQDFLDSFPSFAPGHVADRSSRQGVLSPETLSFLHQMKKQMQLLTTQIVKLDPKDEAAVLEKGFHEEKRKRQRHKNQGDKKPRKEEEKGGNGDRGTASNKDDTNQTTSTNNKERNTKKKMDKKGSNVLQRKRFHNFTPSLMAHEFLAYRRLDRFFHRSTNRIRGRPYISLSLTGDLFLNGQIPRVVGVFLAISRQLIDPEIVDCIFDEFYPHLVPTPPFPSFSIFAGKAAYMNWEGRCKAILCPRDSTRYDGGFRSKELLKEIADWQTCIHDKIATTWEKDGVDKEGRLVAEKKWILEVLEPWAVKANQQLQDYRQWKASRQAAEDSPSTVLSSLDSIDKTTPALFEKTLKLLRAVDSSGNWPSTTLKRQLVMVSTSTNEQDETPASLSMAHMKAKGNKQAARSSAYTFEEGDGGASGSFSVGAMPGDQCIQPKGNELFPELMKAAFELEIALYPNREPSSTIAINRNAQFRPHTDSGAGAGQSTSLIVGLGDYVGGELMVEGEEKDIRYKAIEFNGWKQRHWTMPFKGERFSLVWFTPKGCEGVHGIDLCSS